LHIGGGQRKTGSSPIRVACTSGREHVPESSIVPRTDTSRPIQRETFLPSGKAT